MGSDRKPAAAHGIVGSDGALTADVVRATYARAAKTAEATKRKWTGRNATQRSETNRNNAEKRGETHRNAAECVDEKPDEARANTKPQKQHKAPGAPPDGVKRGRTARNPTGENKSDPPDHGIADLFRHAGFLHTPQTRGDRSMPKTNSNTIETSVQHVPVGIVAALGAKPGGGERNSRSATASSTSTRPERPTTRSAPKHRCSTVTGPR